MTRHLKHRSINGTYQILYPGRALAMNWCIWNNAGIRHQSRANRNKSYSQQKTSENCRARGYNGTGTYDRVLSKPWACYHANGDDDEYNTICNGFHYASDPRWNNHGDGQEMVLAVINPIFSWGIANLMSFRDMNGWILTGPLLSRLLIASSPSHLVLYFIWFNEISVNP
jgi:hypothetical protein